MPANRQQTIKVKHGVFVQAPPDEVASYVEDVDNFPEWQSSLFEVRDKRDLTDGKLKRNAKVRDSRNVLGKKIDSEYAVTDFQEGKKVSLEVQEGDDVYWTMTFSYEPQGGGTFLTAEGGGDLGQIRVGRAAAQKACQRMLEGDLATLRELIETKNGR